MIIPDLFRLNDWSTRRFNLFIWSILVAYDFSFISNVPLYSIEILSKILGFVILTFIPGYIILRIFKVHDIDRVVTLLLAVGLSLSFIMIFGFTVNMFLPYIGVSKPISTFPLFYSLNISILVLMIICYFRDKEFNSSQNQLRITFSPMLFYLILLPLFSIFGTESVNHYNFNVPVLILLFVISLSPILIALDRISRDLYPFMILSISLAILYNMNLISTHLWSYDIFYEAHTSKYVLENGIWNPGNKTMVPLLLFTILSPVYSLICDLNVIWVFKIIFPFFFSLTPLALYYVYKELDFGNYKIDSEIAMLSVFVFIFFYGFYKDMPDKQHIAELFLALILILSIFNTQKRILLFIFSFSLVVSHYGISYFFVFSLIFVSMMSRFRVNADTSFLTPTYTLLFSVLTFSWYIYISAGDVFEVITQVGYHFLSGIKDIFQANDDGRSASAYLSYLSNGILWVIYMLIHLILQFFISIGVLNLLLSIMHKKTKSFEISLLTIIFYAFLFVQFFKTYGMGLDRILQITLILLSPLSIWGYSFCVKNLNSVYARIISKRIYRNKENGNLNLIFESTLTRNEAINKNHKTNLSKKARLCFSIFLMVFFVFNSGFIFWMTGYPLPGYCININPNSGWPVYSESEICGVDWLKSHENEHNRVAVFNQWDTIKSRDGLLVAENFYSKDLIPIRTNTTTLYNSYLFLGKYSVDKVEDGEGDVYLQDTLFYNSTLKTSNKIYNSEKSHLYLAE